MGDFIVIFEQIEIFNKTKELPFPNVEKLAENIKKIIDN